MRTTAKKTMLPVGYLRATCVYSFHLWLHLALVIVVGLGLGVRLPSKLLVFRRLADMAVSFALLV